MRCPQLHASSQPKARYGRSHIKRGNGLRNLVGGQIGAFTKMCEQTRSQAFEAMERHAEELGANAIIGIRYDASSVESQGAAVEVLCYGTAVIARKK